MPAILKAGEVSEYITRREFLKRLFTAGLLAGATALGIEEVLARVTPPNIVARRELSVETIKRGFVMIYRDGKTAIALDEDGNEIVKSVDHAYVLQYVLNRIEAEDLPPIVYINTDYLHIKSDIKLPNTHIVIFGRGTSGSDLYFRGEDTTPPSDAPVVIGRTWFKPNPKITVLLFDGAVLTQDVENIPPNLIYIHDITFVSVNIGDRKCAFRFNGYNELVFERVYFYGWANAKIESLVFLDGGTNNAGVGHTFYLTKFEAFDNWRVPSDKKFRCDILFKSYVSHGLMIKPIFCHNSPTAGKVNGSGAGGLPGAPNEAYHHVIKGYDWVLVKPKYFGSGKAILYATATPKHVVFCPHIEATPRTGGGFFSGILDSISRPSLSHYIVILPLIGASRPYKLFDNYVDARLISVGDLGVGAASLVDLGTLPTDPTQAPHIDANMFKAKCTIPAGTYSAGNVLKFYFKSYALWKTEGKRIILVSYNDAGLPIIVRGYDESDVEEYRGRIDVIFVGSASPATDVTIDINVLIL